MHGHVVVIAAGQIDHARTAFNALGVAGHGDDVLEDHIVG